MTPSQRNWAMTWTKATFLELLLERGPHSLDDVPIPPNCDADAAKSWRGQACRELSADKLIVNGGKTVKSKRKGRNSNRVCLWRILNEDAARTYLGTLRDWLIVNRFPEDSPAPVLTGRQAVGALLAGHVVTLQVLLGELKRDCDVIDTDHVNFDKTDERDPYWNAVRLLEQVDANLGRLGVRLQAERDDFGENKGLP